MILSIVIPVYNAANHIKKCLNSIWAQGLNTNEYEVVCVDDCSTDNSLEILNNISKEHNNLRIIRNNTNRRAGGSRNHGVLEAKGEYIVFIDSDDYFHDNALLEVIKVLKEDANDIDIILCDFARENVGTINNNPTHNWQNKQLMSGKDFMLSNGLPYGPCQYIFRKVLMIDNNIFFEENVSSEDVDWTHKLALQAEKMQYKPILLSHYILYNVSQTADEYRKLRLISERIFAGYRLYQISLKYNNDQEVSKHIEAIAFSYIKRGIMLMTAYCGGTKKKRDIIIKFVPDIKTTIFIVNFARIYPTLFSTISSLLSPFTRLAIILKRRIKGR